MIVESEDCFVPVDTAGTEDDIGLECTRSADQNVSEFWVKEQVAHRTGLERRKEPCCETWYDARTSCESVAGGQAAGSTL
jgi:hypothetical protein